MREAPQAENTRADSRGSAAHAFDNVAASRRRSQRVHRGTSEPPTVALLRHVLNPSVIVLTLMFCAFLFAQELTPSYFALAAVAFRKVRRSGVKRGERPLANVVTSVSPLLGF